MEPVATLPNQFPHALINGVWTIDGLYLLIEKCKKALRCMGFYLRVPEQKGLNKLFLSTMNFHNNLLLYVGPAHKIPLPPKKNV